MKKLLLCCLTVLLLAVACSNKQVSAPPAQNRQIQQSDETANWTSSSVAGVNNKPEYPIVYKYPSNWEPCEDEGCSGNFNLQYWWDPTIPNVLNDLKKVRDNSKLVLFTIGDNTGYFFFGCYQNTSKQFEPNYINYINVSGKNWVQLSIYDPILQHFKTQSDCENFISKMNSNSPVQEKGYEDFNTILMVIKTLKISK